jgi:RNA polymerase sigma factor (sigma-70 family)
MPNRQELEAIFLSNLALVDRIIGATCTRRGLRDDDAADCASWIKLRLVEDDYAILGKFRGESSLGTYLAVVIAMLVRDYRVRRWGRWRPSAAATRCGAIAIRLERLVHKQGYRLGEAAEVLRSSSETPLSDREIATTFKELPARGPLRPIDVGPEPLASTAGSGAADDVLEEEMTAAERATIEGAVLRALQQLAPQDQLILRLRFWVGSSVADIARVTGLPQKPLYRQIERALGQLRDKLTSAQISRERVRELLGGLEP